jgi:hypothetical protein
MIMPRKLNCFNGLQDWKIELQAVTACIVHLADGADFKNSTSRKVYSGLSVSCFESPNDTIHAKR